MIGTAKSSPARVSLDGVEIVYDTFGDPAYPPLLLIAGLANQMIDWRDEFCSELAEQGYWVVRFDNRDAGLSTRLDGIETPGLFAISSAYVLGTSIRASYTLLDMAADALGVLDTLGIETSHVVGGSLGGMIALALAIHHPNRVRSLILGMSTIDPRRRPLPRPKTWPLFWSAPRCWEDYLAHFLRVKRLLSGPRFPLDEADARQLAWQLYERCPNPAGTARQLAAILTSRHQLQGAHSLAIPTLITHGAADPLLPVAHAWNAAQVIPEAKLLIIDGLGHEFPRPIWPTIIRAIREHAV